MKKMKVVYKMGVPGAGAPVAMIPIGRAAANAKVDLG